MVAFAQCDNFIMLVEKEVLLIDNEEELLRQDCRVFNTKTQRISPISLIGSWTCRIGPWISVEQNK